MTQPLLTYIWEWARESHFSQIKGPFQVRSQDLCLFWWRVLFFYCRRCLISLSAGDRFWCLFILPEHINQWHTWSKIFLIPRSVFRSRNKHFLLHLDNRKSLSRFSEKTVYGRGCERIRRRHLLCLNAWRVLLFFSSKTQRWHIAAVFHCARLFLCRTLMA